MNAEEKVVFRCEHGTDPECDKTCLCGHACNRHPMDICLDCPDENKDHSFVDEGGGVRC